MLEVSNLNYSYTKKSKLIDNFSIKIDKGTVYGLLGKNGSGKSTLIYLICGLLRPKSGEIVYDGMIPFGRKIKFLEDIFLVPEEFSMPNISLKEYIKANALFYPKFDHKQFWEYIELFELDPESKLGSLSMGQKKKAYISFALACNTGLLILDEPTNGLDISSKRNFRKAIAKCMTDDKTIIISTHQVYDVDKIIDHVVIMDRKGLLLNESIAEICSRYSFTFTTDPERAAQALASIEVPGGYNIVEPLTDPRQETEVNLETLFEMTMNGLKNNV